MLQTMFWLALSGAALLLPLFCVYWTVSDLLARK